MEGNEPKRGLPPINMGKPEEKITGEDLFAEEGGESRVQASSRIRTFESSSKLVSTGSRTFKRTLNKNGEGATRVRTFNAKLNPPSLSFLDDQINEWLDENPDVEVKLVETTIGTFEAKRPEPHLIVMVWY